jgi:hypothetical protein
VFFFIVLVVSLLLVIPESRVWIDEFIRTSKLTMEANLSVFGIALICAVAASVMSWVASLFPKDQETGDYHRIVRVVSRGRVK